jgi:hypothetical protein
MGKASWHLCYIVEGTQLIWQLQYYSARFDVLVAVSMKNQVRLLVYDAVSSEWSTLWRIVGNDPSNNTASHPRPLECSEIMVWGPPGQCSYTVVCFMSMYSMQSSLSCNWYFEYYVCTWKWTDFQALLVSCHLLQNGAGFFLIWTAAVTVVSGHTVKRWS